MKLLNSQKMRVFYFCLFFLFVIFIFNVFIIADNTLYEKIILGIITLSGITTTGKFLDDFQKSKYYKPELDGGNSE